MRLNAFQETLQCQCTDVSSLKVSSRWRIEDCWSLLKPIRYLTSTSYESTQYIVRTSSPHNRHTASGTTRQGASPPVGTNRVVTWLSRRKARQRQGAPSRAVKRLLLSWISGKRNRRMACMSRIDRNLFSGGSSLLGRLCRVSVFVGMGEGQWLGRRDEVRKSVGAFDTPQCNETWSRSSIHALYNHDETVMSPLSPERESCFSILHTLTNPLLTAIRSLSCRLLPSHTKS